MHRSVAVLALAAAVNASPLAMPQGVTAVITPAGQAAPPSCTPNYPGVFGISVQRLNSPAKRQLQQIGEQVVRYHSHPHTNDTSGQVQVQTVTQLVTLPHTTVAHVTQITDGQIQAPVPTNDVVSELSDGVAQVPTMTAPHATQIGDGQPQVPTAPAAPASPGSAPYVYVCKGPGTLELTLADGVLKDSVGRTGYIADNFQFQFDGPPQAGAIVTAGFSVCANNTLALGGSTVFYQCASGSFYNLYDRSWAGQCEPIFLDIIHLQDCGAGS